MKRFRFCAAAEGSAAWGVVLDTSTGGMAHQGTFVVSTYSIAPRSMAVLWLDVRRSRRQIE